MSRVPQTTAGADASRLCWAGLASFPKFGPARLARLAHRFSSGEQALGASRAELEAARIEPGVIDEFLAWRPRLSLDALAATLEREQLSLLLLGDADYPARLAAVYQPPFLLYARGEVRQEEPAIAIVGARKFTSYGRQVALELAEELARGGLTIVSGLALGIDAIAHEAALEAGGRTIAVLGSGLDRGSLYPSQHRRLADRIVERGGLLLSEFPPGTPPLPHHFPQRNRIIAGLAVATLVIEAAPKSGSLITAQLALEQGREVLAVPGSIYSPLSAGTNQLIKQGATPVTGSGDVWDALDFKDLNQYIDRHAATASPAGLGADEQTVFELLSVEAQHIEQIIKLSGLAAASANAALSLLEIKGLARNVGGMQYIRK